MCDKMEDECELYTVKKFQEAMQKLGDDIYSVKMTKIKLKESMETHFNLQIEKEEVISYYWTILVLF